MKLISFVIPCYNSAEYMSKCIDSIVPGGDDVEILIIDDGSTDETLKIAKDYEKKYPGICRAIHQENKGHGGAVNTGIENAEGIYFKVVDSDDWLDDDGYKRLLEKVRDLTKRGHIVDMFLTNYVYDNEKRKRHRRMVYTAFFSESEDLTWKDMKLHIKGVTILMHSVTFRTSLLRDECKLKLPEHTFYVDNLFVYLPLPYVKKLCYINTTLYHYYIGRDGQSVAEQTMIRRFDQQLKVNYMMFDSLNLYSVKDKDLRKYMMSYLEMVTVVTSCIAYLSKEPVKIRKMKELWKYIKTKDRRVWRHIRFGFFGNAVNIPTKPGKKIGYAFYKISQRIMGFN